MKYKMVIAIAFCLFATPARSQIVPDTALPNHSTVTPEGNLRRIEGGTRRGDNLFHSFDRFSVPANVEAWFNNATDIDTIFTRVTGSELSQIDGTLRANGGANLYLLNPNGIHFGANARLDLGGSFVATSADRIEFADGRFYSATEVQSAPLLTVSVPTGLQFGTNPGAIRLDGSGHSLTVAVPQSTPVQRGDPEAGLSVVPGGTLALIGGEIRFNGGVATASGGEAVVGSVGEGRVEISQSGANVTFDPNGVQTFGNIELSRRSLLDASGVSGGSIRIWGDRVTLEQGAIALVQNQGFGEAGSIDVRASESLELSDITDDGLLAGGLLSETVGIGNGSDINISTERLTLNNGAAIITKSFTPATAGDIRIHATDTLAASGVSPFNPAFSSSITASAFGPGDSGDINIATERLHLSNGAIVGSATFSIGKGGDVRAIASESVKLIGVDPTFFTPTTLSAATFNAGEAGSLQIETGRLMLRDGGRVDSSTFASGAAGSVTVNASELVEVSGTVPGSVNPSIIISSANAVDPSVREFLGLPPFPSGPSGNVTVRTPVLQVTDGARVTVQNDGTGDGGTLAVEVDTLAIDRLGGLTAATISGNGGNVSLRVGDSLQVRRGGTVSAEAGGAGNGGNVNIGADTIALLEDSRIVANAFEGVGGNIQIETLSLFAAPESRINASSQLGVDGTVQIETPDVDPASGLVDLPVELSDPSAKVIRGCAADTGNRFIIIGRGGLPDNPMQALPGRVLWWDWRPVVGEDRMDDTARSPVSEVLREAQGWIVDPDGRVQLVGANALLLGFDGCDRVSDWSN
jgi:filamentous hemagglutinin family protein